MVLLGLLGALSLLPWSPTFASYWRDLVAAHSPSDLSSWGYCNFGILGLLDRLHGTDTKWQAAVQARGGQAYVRWSRKRKAVVESPYPVEERAHPKAD